MAKHPCRSKSEAAKPEAPQRGPQLNFWSVASAVTSTVKAGTAELAANIQHTDWKAELTSFRQGLQQDTEELSHRTTAVVEDAVEHFPVNVRVLSWAVSFNQSPDDSTSWLRTRLQGNQSPDDSTSWLRTRLQGHSIVANHMLIHTLTQAFVCASHRRARC